MIVAPAAQRVGTARAPHGARGAGAEDCEGWPLGLENKLIKLGKLFSARR